MRDPLAERNKVIDNYWAKIQAQAAVITQMEARIIKMQADDRELIAENVALREILSDVYGGTRTICDPAEDYEPKFLTEPIEYLRHRLFRAGAFYPENPRDDKQS